MILFGSYLNAGVTKLVDAETFRFFKGRSRSISLPDYKSEKEFVDQAPHKVLFSSTQKTSQPAKEPPKEIRRAKRPTGCPHF
jgi:hypothetical protein